MKNDYLTQETITPFFVKLLSIIIVFITKNNNLYMNAIFLSIASISALFDLINYYIYKNQKEYVTNKNIKN